jgi:hypothetical protein
VVTVPSAITLRVSSICPHGVFVYFDRISEQTMIISLYSIRWLVFIMYTDGVLCEVGTEVIFHFGWMYSLTRFSHVRFGDASLVAGTRLVERNENDHTQCAIRSFRMKQLDFEVPLKEDLINNCTVGPVWPGASQLVQRYACCLSPCQASPWRQRCWC